MLIDAINVKDFLKLDQETLRTVITFGSYQLKNSYRYLSEHFNENGGIKIGLKGNAHKKKGMVHKNEGNTHNMFFRQCFKIVVEMHI